MQDRFTIHGDADCTGSARRYAEQRAELVAARTAAWARVTGPRIDRTSAAFREWEAAAHAVVNHDQARLGVKR